jgi:hypothetical protein
MFMGEDGKAVGGPNGKFSNGQTIGGGGGFFSSGETIGGANDRKPPVAVPEGRISGSIRGAIVAFENGMWEATDAVIKGARSLHDGLELAKQQHEDRTQEMQSIEDEAGRIRIGAIKDEVAREKAMIAHETAIRMRELQERGLLNDALKGKLLDLQGAQLNAVKGIESPEERMRQQEAVFDARHSRQLFGAGGEDPNTAILRQQLASLKKIEKKDGGLNVV